MKCPNCGNENRDDAFFCGSCYKKLVYSQDVSSALKGKDKKIDDKGSDNQKKGGSSSSGKMILIAAALVIIISAIIVAAIFFFKKKNDADDSENASYSKKDKTSTSKSINDDKEIATETSNAVIDLYDLRGLDVYEVVGKLGISNVEIKISGSKASFDNGTIYGNGYKDSKGQYILNKIGFKAKTDYICCGVSYGMTVDEALTAIKSYCTDNVDLMNDLYNSEYWIDTFTQTGDLLGVYAKDKNSKVEKALIIFRNADFNESDLTPEQCMIAVKNNYYGGKNNWKDVDSDKGEYWTVEHIEQMSCTIRHSLDRETINRYKVNMRSGETTVTVEKLGSGEGEKEDTSIGGFNARDFLK